MNLLHTFFAVVVALVLSIFGTTLTNQDVDTTVITATSSVVITESGTSTQSYGIDGRYETQYGNYVNVKNLGNNKISLIGQSHYQTAGSSTNEGFLEATTTILNNKAIYTPTDFVYDKVNPCTVTFIFSSNKVHIDTQNSQNCGWGHNVDFAGDYVLKQKISDNQTTSTFVGEKYVTVKKKLLEQGWAVDTSKILSSSPSSGDKKYPEIYGCGNGVDAVCSVDFKKGKEGKSFYVQIGGNTTNGSYPEWTIIDVVQ